ncbi:hypothetical protein HK099_007682 [Clydaea vesicula]|uniref:Uncharacterized protein n=1 Tax=Clydaea vesicula TaxID=447962 RepID=A0AAD5TWK5_9FUNG|nr:hypothetical protein HK099_007682 [Clydaea vesicula]
MPFGLTSYVFNSADLSFVLGMALALTLLIVLKSMKNLKRNTLLVYLTFIAAITQGMNLITMQMSSSHRWTNTECWCCAALIIRATIFNDKFTKYLKVFSWILLFCLTFCNTYAQFIHYELISEPDLMECYNNGKHAKQMHQSGGDEQSKVDGVQRNYKNFMMNLIVSDFGFIWVQFLVFCATLENLFLIYITQNISVMLSGCGYVIIPKKHLILGGKTLNTKVEKKEPTEERFTPYQYDV